MFIFISTFNLGLLSVFLPADDPLGDSVCGLQRQQGCGDTGEIRPVSQVGVFLFNLHIITNYLRLLGQAFRTK